MSKKIASVAALAAALMLALAGCSGQSDAPTASQSSSSGNGYGAPAPSQSQSVNDTGAMLSTADSDLGKIVVDQRGMTVYQFDKDTQNSGKSSCTGSCLDAWPPVPATEDSLKNAQGITGELGTITGTNGKEQLTLNGWPLYYYAPDTAAGDTKGQAAQDVWWVIDAKGDPIH
ncbi:hypothetical protein [Glutamicibacter sp.]|uniref:COG4315 family predicted lipoprotein n=1 Tax=Glutamicibacter sp. TaxID=1931995 RepID=UPI0028BE8A52|nr:hypothetical protein [Glutamicibacter sp.]